MESEKLEASKAISEDILPIPLKLKHVAKICGNSIMIEIREKVAKIIYFLSSVEAFII